jgi:pilus assembly protein CpaC
MLAGLLWPIAALAAPQEGTPGAPIGTPVNAAVAPAQQTPATQTPPAKQAPMVELHPGRSYRLTAPWPVKGVSLTDPQVADVQVLTLDQVLISGKKVGETDVFIWSENGQTQELRVVVNADLERLRRDLAVLFGGSALDVQQTQTVVIVSGTLTRADQATELHAYLDALQLPYVDSTVLPGVQQVEVHVRMAEVSRTAIRALGVNALKSGEDFFGGSTIGPSNGTPINPFSIGPSEGSTALGNTPFVFTKPPTVSPAVTMFMGFPNSDLELFIQALAENQYLRILAEPNLVALSGEEASFLAGGEFPIPVVQGTGAGAGTSVTIEYKQFGVRLKFRPTVLGENAIRLQIASEVSDLTDIGSVELQGFRVPALVTRRADTTLEMRSGQTFAMAGLINESTNAQAARVPMLGDLPVLGTLFRSVRYRSAETELLVLVTASLVEPLSDVTFGPLPGTDHVRPQDWELYMEGRIEGLTPGRIPPNASEWMRSSGLDRLRGPGAWATHEQPPAQSTARPKPSEPRADAGASSPSAPGAAAPSAKG